MKRQPWGLYAIALATAVVGLVALGVPASTLLVAALALACPLMMMFMMAGMHGGHGDTDRTVAHHGPVPDHRQDEPTAGRR
jgi:CBS-domain-containing membrane protein